MLDLIKEKYEERKREELEASLRDGQIADPFSSTILISFAISAALSTASYLVSRALAPKPPKLEQGRLSGSLQLQNSEQGIFIPEIYGSGPTVSLVTGSNPTYQNLANVATGANGSITKNVADTNWNAGASHNVAIASGDDAFFQFVVGTGYATAGFTLDSSPTSGNTDFLFAIQWNPDGSISIKYNSTQVLGGVTHWVAGDTFRLELRDGRFRLYKGFAEIFPQGMIIPSPSYPLYMGIAMQYNGAGISNGKVQINNIGLGSNAGRGGVKVPAIIPWTSGIRKTVTTTQQPTGGGKGGGGKPQTVENTVYDIDIALMYAARGPYRLLREYANADILLDQFAQSANPTGVHDPTVGPDPDYDPTTPPDPGINYITPIHRVDAAIAVDGDGVGTGNIQGGGSSFAIYPGNTDQQPDPVIEADIDGKYGAGSTTAHKNKFYIRHSQYNLSRWGGIVPNHTAVLEHQTLVTLSAIYGSFCERVGVLAANSDYDLSGLSAIQPRGLLISGRAFAPAEVMDSAEVKLALNYFVTEREGQIIGFVEGAEPSVTIADTEIGWLDGDEDLPDIAPEVESILVAEINLPREIHFKSIDPDSEWDLNTQLASRQITDGQTVELLEVQLCQLSDERRATAQRALFQRYVAGSAHKFTLSWKYLYLYPGYKVIVTRAEGFTHTMRLTSISGGVGVLECEGIALEPEVFNQPANGVFPPGYIAPQPIPAMIVMTMLDIPIFRSVDEGKIGYYAGGTPRTGLNQTFQGWTLHSQRNSIWSLRGSSNLPATIGTVVSSTAAVVADDTFDLTGVVTVDLYGTDATLSSVTEAAVRAGENLAIAGDSIFGYATATQVGGFPNRWALSDLLSGLDGTEALFNVGNLVGKRFVVLDGAIQFIDTEPDELNLLLPYRGVAVGQSLDDSALIYFAWLGKSLTPGRPTGIEVYRDTKVGSLANQIQLLIPTREHEVGETVKYWVDVFSATAGPTFTVDASTNVFTSTSHGLVAGDIIALSTSSTLPQPLHVYKHYYLRDITTHTFKLSESDGGDAIDILNTGSGTHKFTKRVRHMPVVNVGAFNPAVFTADFGGWIHTITAGSGGWDSTIDTDWVDRNNADGAAFAVGSGTVAYALALVTESGGEVEFTLGTVDYAPGAATRASLMLPSAPDYSVEGTHTSQREMRFALFTDTDLPPSKAGSRRWKLTIYERIGGSMTLVYTDPDLELPGVRYRMQVSGSEVRYYRDYGGPNSTLLYRSTVAVPFPLRPIFEVDIEHVLENVKIGGSPECITTYPDTDMISDFGTQPATVRFRVYEDRVFAGYSFFGNVTDFIT